MKMHIISWLQLHGYYAMFCIYIYVGLKQLYQLKSQEKRMLVILVVLGDFNNGILGWMKIVKVGINTHLRLHNVCCSMVLVGKR